MQTNMTCMLVCLSYMRNKETGRPQNFSTYVPRELVRKLKVVAAIRDVALWTIVTDALELYLARFQDQHGQLPNLDSGQNDVARGKG